MSQIISFSFHISLVICITFHLSHVNAVTFHMSHAICVAFQLPAAISKILAMLMTSEFSSIIVCNCTGYICHFFHISSGSHVISVTFHMSQCDIVTCNVPGPSRQFLFLSCVPDVKIFLKNSFATFSLSLFTCHLGHFLHVTFHTSLFTRHLCRFFHVTFVTFQPPIPELCS